MDSQRPYEDQEGKLSVLLQDRKPVVYGKVSLLSHLRGRIALLVVNRPTSTTNKRHTDEAAILGCVVHGGNPIVGEIFINCT